MKHGTYEPEKVKVHLYRDDDRTSHVTVVEITDLGSMVDMGAVEPSSDAMLAQLARKQLVDDGRFTREEVDSFTIFVARERAA